MTIFPDHALKGSSTRGHEFMILSMGEIDEIVHEAKTVTGKPFLYK